MKDLHFIAAYRGMIGIVLESARRQAFLRALPKKVSAFTDILPKLYDKLLADVILCPHLARPVSPPGLQNSKFM